MSPDKPVLFDYFNETANLLLSNYKRSAQQGSSTILGENRESFCSNFLNNVLPTRLSIKKGEILDSQNNRTGQQDVIIIRNDCASLAFGLVNTYLVEGVFAVIEVKSNLTSDKLVEAGNSLEKVRKLSISTIGGFSSTVLRRPLRIVFAYKGATWDTVDKTLEENKFEPEIFDLICILERGIAIKTGKLIGVPKGNQADYITVDGKAAALGFLYYYLVSYGINFLTSKINLQSYFTPWGKWTPKKA